MNNDRLRRLKQITQELATEFGEDLGLFGMVLDDVQWKDGEAEGYLYWPKGKLITEFNKQDCLRTIQHVCEWWGDEE